MRTGFPCLLDEHVSGETADGRVFQTRLSPRRNDSFATGRPTGIRDCRMGADPRLTNLSEIPPFVDSLLKFVFKPRLGCLELPQLFAFLLHGSPRSSLDIYEKVSLF